MTRVVSIDFAKAFQRHVDCPADSLPGATVGEVLAAYFDRHPVVRGYVVDDSGSARRHVAIFLGDGLIADRDGLSDEVTDGDRIHVFQALSGG